MWKTILFDLDGTLTESAPGITKSVQYALRYFGIIEEDLQKLECFVGPPLLEQFMHYAGLSKEQATKAVEVYRERYATIGIFENSPYPQIDRILTKLKEDGFVLAVASSKPTCFVEQILEHFELRSYFQVVVGSELDGRRTKKEEVIAEALSQLGTELSTQQVIMVGDKAHDVQGARKLGIPCVGVAYGYGGWEELEEAGAYAIVDTVEALGDYLVEGKLSRAIDNPIAPPESNALKRETLPGKIWRVVYPILIHSGMGMVVSMLGGLLLMLYYMFVHSDQLGDIASATYQYTLLYTLAADFLMVPVLYWFFVKDQRRWDLIGIKRKKNPVFFVLMGIIMAAASHTLSLLISILRIDILFPSYSEVSEEILSGQSTWLVVLALGIAAPIAEELVFRGLIFRRIANYMNVKWGIILSALLFGIYHGNIVQFIYATCIGVVLAWLYHKTGTLWAPIAAHMVMNIWSLIAVTLIEVLGGASAVLPFMAIEVVITIIGGWYLVDRDYQA